MSKFEKHTILLIGLLIYSSSNLFSQVQERYFSDTEVKPGSTVEYSISSNGYLFFCGSTVNTFTNQPYVSKIDSLGNLIWNSSDFDTASLNICTYKQIFADRGNLYGYQECNGTMSRYIKMDALTGQTTWGKDFNIKTTQIIDYDSSSFIVSFLTATYNKPGFFFVSKNNGDTSGTKIMGSNVSSIYAMSLDPNHEIYFSIKDTLFKFSAAIGHPLLWKTVTPTSSYIKDHVRLLVGSSDSMYACSIYTNSAQTSLNGKVLCFNKVNGALLWETIATSTSNSDQQVNNVSVLEDDSTIVTSWKHAYVGSGSNQLITCKIRKKEGGLVWKSKITYTKHSAAIAIAEDNQNNLYLTGYFNSDNYGPGNWNLIKLNGKNGQTLFEVKIAEDTAVNNGLSWGKAAYVYNNKVVLLGEIETGENESKVCRIELDKSNGAVQSKKYFGGAYRIKSSVVDLVNYSKDFNIILKQYGRKLEVENYNRTRTLLWSKVLQKPTLFYGGKIAKGKGKIAIVGFSGNIDFNQPNAISPTNYLNIVILDSATGNVQKQVNLSIGDPSLELVDVFLDSTDELYVFYKIANTLYMIKVYAGFYSYSSPINLGSYLDYFCESSKLYTDISSTELCFFGFTYPSLRSINKQTLAITNFGNNAPYFSTCRDALRDKNNLIYMGGSLLGNEYLVCYNLSTRDTVWTKLYPNSNGEIYKLSFDKDSSNLIAVSVIGNNTRLRCLSKLDGTLLWTKTRLSPSGQASVPTDLKFNKANNTAIYTGYTGITSNSSAFVEVVSLVDSSVVLSVIKSGDSIGFNRSTVAGVFEDGATWFCGNVKLTNKGDAGFIFEFVEGDTLNTLRGYTFYDLNKNGIKDSIEAVLPFIKTAMPDNAHSNFSNLAGEYTYFVGSGNHTIQSQPVLHWMLSSDSSEYHLNLGYHQNISNLNFGYVPKDTICSLSLAISSGYTRCDNAVPFYVSCKNDGTMANSGIIWCRTDSRIQNITWIDQPDTILSIHAFGWHYNNMFPSQILTKQFLVTVPGISAGIQLGDSITLSAFSKPNNYNDTFDFTYSPAIFCSFDPNDKLTNPKRGEPNYILPSEKITYTIRFQNTGNDTAKNIVVIDTLDKNLQLSTLKIISSSHFDKLSFSTDSPSIYFNFLNINLPDSGKSYSGSQGFVTFQVEPVKGLIPQTVITNTANIYFDANPAIVTNLVKNTIVNNIPLAIISNGDAYSSWTIYPNPNNGKLIIANPVFKKSDKLELNVYNILGERVHTENPKLRNGELELNHSLPSGIYLLKVAVANQQVNVKFIVARE
jgi:uncharacterized repeat protein (TIGR01451 family)